MKQVAVALIGVLAAAAAPTSQPHTVPRHDCTRVSRGLEMDGALDDAAWATVPWTDDFVDIVGHADRPKPALRTRAKLAWDEANLYIAAELTEPRVAASIRERDAQLYKEQAFEVFLDPGGDGRDYLELQINPLNTVCDLLMSRPYRDRGKADIAFDLSGLRAFVRVRGTVNEPSDTDQGWNVEVAIPWPALKQLRGDSETAPAQGERWRVNFARMHPVEADAANAAPRRDMWVWAAQGEANLHVPERWGWVEFREADPERQRQQQGGGR